MVAICQAIGLRPVHACRARDNALRLLLLLLEPEHDRADFSTDIVSKMSNGDSITVRTLTSVRIRRLLGRKEAKTQTQQLPYVLLFIPLNKGLTQEPMSACACTSLYAAGTR